MPNFQNLAKQNKFQVKTMFTIGQTVGLAEWIIDDTYLVYFFVPNRCSIIHLKVASRNIISHRTKYV